MKTKTTEKKRSNIDKLFRRSEYSEYQITHLGPGDVLGEETLFGPDPEPRFGYARSIVRTDLIFLERTSLLDFLEDQPRLFRDFCRNLTSGLQELEQKLLQDGFLTTDRRLAELLGKVEEKLSDRGDGGNSLITSSPSEEVEPDVAVPDRNSQDICNFAQPTTLDFVVNGVNSSTRSCHSELTKQLLHRSGDSSWFIFHLSCAILSLKTSL